MKQKLNTDRLTLEGLTLSNADFIIELVNQESWIKYIGKRDIFTVEAAEKYIQKIIDNPLAHYWVVYSSEHRLPIGVITLLKRQHLDFPDLGFAFLDRYTGMGFAYEAAQCVMKELIAEKKYTCLLGITLHDNTDSIKLLEKLEFKFDKHMEEDSDLMAVYSTRLK